MGTKNTARGIRNRARFYTVGAVGVSVAGVVGFFSTVGATAAAHPVARPIAGAKAGGIGHGHGRHVPPRAAQSQAPEVAVSGPAHHPRVPVRSLGSGRYVAPAAAPKPAAATKPVSAPKPVFTPAPQQAAPQPVAVAPQPSPAPQPYAPPPAPTHSS